MKRSKKNIERNKLDYLLTDIMPVEVSELFSFSKFYEYLLSKQSTLDDIVSKMRAMKAENSETPFAGGKWGNWATSPLKFNILKGTDSIRGLNLVQPLSAMNIYFFVECYQKELLDILSNNSCFSLRYHRKNSDLFYRRKSKKIVDYFEKTSQKVDRAILQQTGAYSFVFEKGNMNDLCNWFVFFHDYSVPLLRNTEAILEKKLREEDNPILWANYLIYSRYHSDYHKEILIWVEELLQYKVNQIGSKDPLLQKEFWYVITFINCPYISGSVKTALEGIVRPMATAAETNLANKIKKIIAEFLLQNKSNLFFCWGYYHFNTSKQLTFRTYQRTLFKQYKNKRSIELYGSLDT